MRIRISPNPVLVKELRGRMRGPRAYLFLTAALALLGVVSYGLYRLAADSALFPSGGLPQGAMIGQSVFTGLVYVALMMVCVAAPFLTAGSISGETERKTLDLLLATPLRPATLLFGKLAAAFAFIALLLLAAVPLASLAFVFGGVAVGDMLRAFLLLLGFAVVWSVVGLFFSALLRRTGAALVASYLLLALSIVGTTFAFAVNSITQQRTAPSWLLIPNPLAALASLLTMPSGFPGDPRILARSSFPVGIGVFGPLLGVFGQPVANPANGDYAPLWQYTLGFYGWLAAAMYLASTQLVKPVRRFRLRRRAWAVAALVLVVPLLAAPVVYGPFTPPRLVAWVRWLRSSPQELLANGALQEPLSGAWKVKLEPAGEAQDAVKPVSGGERPALRLARAGEEPGRISLTQAISATVPADGWLQVRAVLRVESQAVAACGEQGDSCPLTLKLLYDDAEGRRHEWRQGFYLEPGPYPPYCTNCETRQAHIQAPAGRWYTYESPNLLEEQAGAPSEWQLKMGVPYSLPAPPRTIHSLVIEGAGTAFEAQVAEIQLITREGRPLRWGRDAGEVEPTPVPGMPVPVRAVPAGIVVPPEPVATEPPAPTPTPAKETPAKE